MKHRNHPAAGRISRFALVGTVNTVINFAVLNLTFHALRQSKLTASFVATTCAVACSFVLNRSFVFMDKERSRHTFWRFLIVSGFGVLVIQNTVYALADTMLEGYEYRIAGDIHLLTGISLSGNAANINLSNAIASLAVMIWNYNGYRAFVFRGAKREYEIEPADEVAAA